MKLIPATKKTLEKLKDFGVHYTLENIYSVNPEKVYKTQITSGKFISMKYIAVIELKYDHMVSVFESLNKSYPKEPLFNLHKVELLFILFPRGYKHKPEKQQTVFLAKTKD